MCLIARGIAMHRFKHPVLIATLLLLLAAQPGLAQTAGVYTELQSLIPRVGQGEGTVSPYGNAKPEFQTIANNEIVRIPASGRGNIDFVWSFWGHRQPSAASWPTGGDARSSLILMSDADAELLTQLSVRTTQGWSGTIDGPRVQLKARELARLLIHLPPEIPQGDVLQVRIQMQSRRNIPELRIVHFSVGKLEPVTLEPVPSQSPHTSKHIEIAGRTSADSQVKVKAFDPSGRQFTEFDLQASETGEFFIRAPRSALPAGPIKLRAGIVESDQTVARWANDVRVYVYPDLKPRHQLPMVRREGRHLLVDNKPWAFMGLNYTHFLLGFARNPDFETVAEDFRKYADWGVSVIRIPLHLGMFQPRPGVFPDDPEYATIIRSHGLDHRFFELFDYAVAVAGHHGIRIVLDWHEMPTDPYRYFVGGNNHDAGTGRPGTGIAWLYDQDKQSAKGPGDQAFVQAIADTNRWLARRYKGNGNIFAFEAPYNEPHSIEDSAEFAWRQITIASIRPIVAEDPERLTFGMPPAWGHSNVLPSVTWLLPDEMDGMTPHHYLSNGPIPFREDAKERKEPWLARDRSATFDHSFYAVSLPHSAAPYPVWNGESGEHGYQSFLPELSHREAASFMIEAQTVQAYAAGWTGSLGWTLTGHPTVYQPIEDLYESIYRRFSPVYAAGPVEMDNAQVLFVQNPGAVPVANGLNHALVPFAKLALDLHLTPVHYMTDVQLLSTGLVQMAVGLEQVEQITAGLPYQAIVVDTRNLDRRALELVQSSGIPVLVVEDAAALSQTRLAEFLKSAGIQMDELTPSELQLIKGPKHLLVYRRSGDGPARIHPRLDWEGSFTLVDENGVTAFKGTASELIDEGIEIDLPTWRTAIYRIQK